MRGVVFVGILTMAACGSFGSNDGPAAPADAGTTLPDGGAGVSADGAALQDAASSDAGPVSAYAAMIKALGPLAYWRMNLVNGAVADEMGGPSLVLNGSESDFSSAAGALANESDGAVHFKNSDNQGLKTPVSAFTFPNKAHFTVECWAKSDVVNAAAQTLFGNFHNSGYGLFLDPQNHLVVLYGNGLDNSSSTSPVGAVGSWHHYALVFDGDTASGFIDGIAPTNVRGNAFTDNGAPFRVGGLPDAPASASFQGAIDEVVVYGRALSSAELLSHVAAGGGAH